jgi:hypothetical protein
MADESIVCPVCNAGQPPQPTCRRCRADLALYLKALASVAIARRELGDASSVAPHAWRDYLAWLVGSAKANGGSILDRSCRAHGLAEARGFGFRARRLVLREGVVDRLP